MKKVLLSAFAGLFIIGATTAYTNRSGARISYRQSITDTVPKDTTKGKLTAVWTANQEYLVRDTVPPDTTKPSKAALRFAYADQADRMIRDTVPNDTTKPKASLYMAYANQIIRDTVPPDTTKPKANWDVAVLR